MPDEAVDAGDFLDRARVSPQSVALIVLCAFVVRLLFVIPGHRVLLNPAEDHFRFGWEVGRVARSIATGHGFSSPYGGETGPTAALAPAYPHLLAGVFRCFGVYSERSAYAILILNSLFSALTAWPLFRIAEEIFEAAVAKWTAWIWVVLYSAVFFSVQVVWETTLTAWLLTWLVLLTLRVARSASTPNSIIFGFIYGLTALSNPAVLSLSPVLFGWVWLQQRRDRFRALRCTALALTTLVLTLAPWLVRDYRQFGRPLPIRSNFGLELRVGNNPWATGQQLDRVHPAHNPAEFEAYKRLGELQYMTEKRQQAVGFIEQHPREFGWLTIKRIGLWWVEGWKVSGDAPLTDFGSRAELFAYSLFAVLSLLGLTLAIRRGIREAYLLAGVLLVYPLVYYLTFVNSRLRHPLEPLMLLLSVYAVRRAIQEQREVRVLGSQNAN